MIEPRYRWRFPVRADVHPGLRAAADDRGIHPRVTEILVARGVTDADGLAAFLGPPQSGLGDPRLLPDADRVVDRIRRARADGEGVLVFGDFDADGLTGQAVMVRALRTLGIDAAPHVPSRLSEGHGLSVRAVERARAEGRALIITVDCGSSSPDEIDLARAAGIDVIVTDHHHVPERALAAVAFVNPHRHGSAYPDDRLAGSGVAFTVARLLFGELTGDADAALGLADLATIGTVADLAPVVGENRAIARIGLAAMREAPRPGIAALLERAGVSPDAVDLETVAFQIAPRLNAAGRVGEADDAARLLLADDAASAAVAADALEAANRLRREMLRTATAEAQAALEADPDLASAAAIVLDGPWSPGIVGLIAARLVDERGRPAVVAARVDGILRASCRSPGTLDLATTLAACSDLLIRHGGHAGAAGFETDAERWDAFRERFIRLAATARPVDARRELALDLALRGPELDFPLVRGLGALEPTGPGNPVPVIGVLGLTVTRSRAATGGHTQLTLRRDRDVVDAIAFGREDIATAVREGDRVDVAARVRVRHFGGYESMQLEIRDIASAGAEQPSARVAAELSR